jgi:hypothetical protein
LRGGAAACHSTAGSPTAGPVDGSPPLGT